MQNAFLISLIGSGLVFVGLILLWFMMSLLVRLTSERAVPAPALAPDSVPEISGTPSIETDGLKQRAAAAAVALGLALSQNSIKHPVGQGCQGLSPWQHHHRSRQINQAGAWTPRKGS